MPAMFVLHTWVRSSSFCKPPLSDKYINVDANHEHDNAFVFTDEMIGTIHHVDASSS